MLLISISCRYCSNSIYPPSWIQVFHIRQKLLEVVVGHNWHCMFSDMYSLGFILCGSYNSVFRKQRKHERWENWVHISPVKVDYNKVPKQKREKKKGGKARITTGRTTSCLELHDPLSSCHRAYGEGIHRPVSKGGEYVLGWQCNCLQNLMKCKVLEVHRGSNAPHPMCLCLHWALLVGMTSQNSGRVSCSCPGLSLPRKKKHGLTTTGSL